MCIYIRLTLSSSGSNSRRGIFQHHESHARITTKGLAPPLSGMRQFKGVLTPVAAAAITDIDDDDDDGDDDGDDDDGRRERGKSQVIVI